MSKQIKAFAVSGIDLKEALRVLSKARVAQSKAFRGYVVIAADAETNTAVVSVVGLTASVTVRIKAVASASDSIVLPYTQLKKLADTLPSAEYTFAQKPDGKVEVGAGHEAFVTFENNGVTMSVIPPEGTPELIGVISARLLYEAVSRTAKFCNRDLEDIGMGSVLFDIGTHGKLETVATNGYTVSRFLSQGVEADIVTDVQFMLRGRDLDHLAKLAKDAMRRDTAVSIHRAQSVGEEVVRFGFGGYELDIARLRGQRFVDYESVFPRLYNATAEIDLDKLNAAFKRVSKSGLGKGNVLDFRLSDGYLDLLGNDVVERIPCDTTGNFDDTVRLATEYVKNTLACMSATTITFKCGFKQEPVLFEEHGRDDGGFYHCVLIMPNFYTR